MTDTQTAIYGIIITLNDGYPTTEENNQRLLAIDWASIGISERDVKAAIRQYEHNVGVTLAAA